MRLPQQKSLTDRTEGRPRDNGFCSSIVGRRGNGPRNGGWRRRGATSRDKVDDGSAGEGKSSRGSRMLWGFFFPHCRRMAGMAQIYRRRWRAGQARGRDGVNAVGCTCAPAWLVGCLVVACLLQSSSVIRQRRSILRGCKGRTSTEGGRRNQSKGGARCFPQINLPNTQSPKTCPCFWHPHPKGSMRAIRQGSRCNASFPRSLHCMFGRAFLHPTQYLRPAFLGPVPRHHGWNSAGVGDGAAAIH